MRIATDTIINDFSEDALAKMEAAGAVPFAIFDDGTEQQVEWSEVHDPSEDEHESSAEVASKEAGAIATALGQRFVSDDNGAHVCSAVKADGTADPSSGPNSTWNASGMVIRNGENNQLAVTPSGVSIYDGAGNDASHVRAVYDGKGTHLYDPGGNERATVGATGLAVFDASGTRKALIGQSLAQLGDGSSFHATVTNTAFKLFDGGTETGSFTSNSATFSTVAGNISFGSGDIEGNPAAAIYGPDGGDSIMLLPKNGSDAWMFITGSSSAAAESTFYLRASKLYISPSGTAPSPIATADAVKVLGSNWKSASITNSTAGNPGSSSNECYINAGLGLAYIGVDMAFSGDGWKPGTGTWLFRLPSGLRPSSTRTVHNLLDITVGGVSYGAHVTVDSSGYARPTWAWQSTSIRVAKLIPLALLGL